MTPLITHALQPTLIQDVFQRMTQQGQSLHLVSKDEAHRQRLLEDLKKASPEDWQVALISFYTYRQSYLNFVEKLAQALGIQERKELSLSVIKKHIEDHPKIHFLFLLDDFEKIANRMDADTRYDGDFVGHLNNMREMPNVRLVIASEKAGRNYWLKKDDDHKIKLSWLFAGLEELSLPQYSHDDIRRELGRHVALTQQKTELIVDQFAHPMATLNSTIQYLQNAGAIDEHLETNLKQHLESAKTKPIGTIHRFLIDLQYQLEKWKLYNKPALVIIGIILLGVVFVSANQHWRDTIWNWCIHKIFGTDK